MIKITRCFLLCLGTAWFCAAVILPVPIFAQNSKARFPKITPKGPPLPIMGYRYWQEQKKEAKAITDQTWAFEQWTGDDAPYAALRTRIERKAAAGELSIKAIAQYAEQARLEPANPQAQFTWAYAVYLAGKSASASTLVPDVHFAAELAIAEAPQPHTYNYDRLHYLIWTQSGGGGPSYYLRDLSVRMLKKDPDDFSVLLEQALIYIQHHYKEPNPQGHMLIQALLRKYPKRPEVYDALGCWYYSQYMFYHDPKNYPLAITYYQKAMEMYPLKSVRRADLPYLMDFLTKRYHQISRS